MPLRIVVVVLLQGLWLMPSAFAQSYVRYRWRAVTDSKGYVGIVEQGAHKTRILTQSESVILPEQVRLVAVYPFNKLYRHKYLPTSQSRVDLARLTRNNKSAKKKHRTQPINHQNAAPEDTDPWPETAPSVKKLSRYGLALGLGRESIHAQIVGSEFRSTATIANTALQAQYQDHRSRWVIDSVASAHYFAAEFDSNQDGAASAVGSTRILRFLIQTLGYYDFFYEKESPFLALGLGVNLVRLPVLEVDASESSQISLGAQTFIAPLAAIRYAWLGNSDSYQVGSQLAWQPRTINGRLRGTGYQYGLFADYRIAQQWSLELTAWQSQYRYTVERNCEDLLNCKQSDLSTDTTGLIKLGLSYLPH